ncbi:YggS family pyridoxal phosphate-dependent enzyme [Tissierella sp. MSJ-40]|uniref:Pyridoxal phosphate homeostasis protein n=1 Tax=Tissierella simiarum TaxID=2841534 RepID=A0ABS6EBR4_9FIRM|nr:YggS family pyridoxal phosphate-dependent enzyme [Tissierella simiarum]
MSIKDNLLAIEENIEKALIKSGRKDDKVELIAVTKTIDVDRIQEAINLGITNIGENRVQELEKKIEVIGGKVDYHMIGHLQTNKVKYIVPKVKMIHSLDRLSLAKELNKRANMNSLTINALIEVNVAEEESKFGLKIQEVVPFIEEVLKFKNIRVKGLMTIAPYTENVESIRYVFKELYKLKEDISRRNYENLSMDYLSMGMTNDYEVAIEEGSNMIRIGTGIFGTRNY